MMTMSGPPGLSQQQSAIQRRSRPEDAAMHITVRQSNNYKSENRVIHDRVN